MKIQIYFAPYRAQDQFDDRFPGRRAARSALGYYISRFQREELWLFLITVIFTSEGYCFE